MKREEDEEIAAWQDYVEEDVVQQLQKVVSTTALGSLQQELQRVWHYQYVVSWLYLVCDSFFTKEAGKAMWSMIQFDELMMLQDITMASSDEESVYDKIREQILRTITQNKNALLKEWDVAIKYHLEPVESLSWYTQSSALFDDFSLQEQFEIIYACVKHIERRSVGFRNYLSAHLYLFQYVELSLSDRSSLLVLPAAKLVQKRLVYAEGNDLNVPIKLRNCTVRYETDGEVEVRHLDFGADVDHYLNRLSPEFSLLTTNWDEFIDYFETTEDAYIKQFLAGFLAMNASNELNSRRLLHNRERERSMAELLVRRKRSSRLVAREEESQRRVIEMQWIEKLDERDQLLRARQRSAAKLTRVVKDTMWSLLWDRFEQDLKVEKLRRRHELHETQSATTPEPTPSPGLGANGFATSANTNAGSPGGITHIDAAVLETGPKFHEPLVNVPEPLPMALEATSLELPDHLLITSADLGNLANHGIDASNYAPDSSDWLFQCPCNAVAGINLDNDDNVRGRALVCCDVCLRWQHLECQLSAWLELQAKPGAAFNGGAENLATAELGTSRNYRRSARRQTPDGPEHDTQDRPISKMAASAHTDPFMCAWCLQELERDMRNAFAPELKSLRVKQQKQYEERERRKKQKELQKRLTSQQPQRMRQSQPQPKQQLKPSLKRQPVARVHSSTQAPPPSPFQLPSQNHL
ncbi:LAMI_0H15940g1_1 [Lachancea mirantina]|uniref:LAMI_0H15940g1_1 n=1 Tax=Lachancea mirantina TaxID=1230905 RepID=A0A1G4KIR9_9SACH|nr:LAMI_0H15940g1_1 [Lachancea mirantina]